VKKLGRTVAGIRQYRAKLVLGNLPPPARLLSNSWSRLALGNPLDLVTLTMNFLSMHHNWGLA